MISLGHIFICCDRDAPEADILADLGLTEGSGNVHSGQGAANRRFFFEGGFIELVWVERAGEARSEHPSPTRLWQRWWNRDCGACSFGIVFSPVGSPAPSPPFPTWTYRPAYLDRNREILFAKGTPIEEPELTELSSPLHVVTWGRTALGTSKIVFKHSMEYGMMRRVALQRS